MLAKWQKAAPNLAGKIVSTAMEDPEENEIRFPNMRRGSIKHGDYLPIQLGRTTEAQRTQRVDGENRGDRKCISALTPLSA